MELGRDSDTGGQVVLSFKFSYNIRIFFLYHKLARSDLSQLNKFVASYSGNYSYMVLCTA